MIAKRGVALSRAVLDGKVDPINLGWKRERSGNRKSEEINGWAVAGNSGRCSTEQQVISRYGRFISDTCENDQGHSELVEKLRVFTAGLRG